MNESHLGSNWEKNSRRPGGIVVDHLLRHLHNSGGRDRLSGAKVPHEPRVRSARDLDPDAMASSEPLSRGPKLYPNLEDAVLRFLPATRIHTLDSITDVRRASGLVHVAQANEDIKVLKA